MPFLTRNFHVLSVLFEDLKKIEVNIIVFWHLVQDCNSKNKYIQQVFIFYVWYEAIIDTCFSVYSTWSNGVFLRLLDESVWDPACTFIQFGRGPTEHSCDSWAKLCETLLVHLFNLYRHLVLTCSVWYLLFQQTTPQVIQCVHVSKTTLRTNAHLLGPLAMI